MTEHMHENMLPKGKDKYVRGTDKPTRPSRHTDYVSLLGFKTRKQSEFITQVLSGFPFQAMGMLGKKTGLTSAQIRAAIGMSERTLARRRKAAGKKFTIEESDRLVRISRVFALALDLFEGNAEAAKRWMLNPNRAFNEAPMTMIRTEVGSREVENLIGQLEHGVFS
ncbi:MAG: DUF2384 domain-containing protein [Acidobacteriota bacterium]|nr:DUF2384 domain-containing protein [Blastocatellia bacterium]MDQ3490549.1 DUF2384 domain-containing protein [Acidobacteriota bacterium]